MCVFDAITGKAYKPKNRLRHRIHLYRNDTIKYPWLQHSNSAIPLDWLRKVGYGNGQSIGMARIDKKVMTDSPIWAKAQIDGLKFGFFEDIVQNSWKQCFQIIHNNNVNRYTIEKFRADFVEIKSKLPEVTQ